MKEPVKEKVYGTPRLWIDPPMSPFCPGCQYPIIARCVCEVIDEMGIEGKVISPGGAGCNGFLLRTFDWDGAQEAHGRGPDLATAIKRIHPDAVVFTMQGDGDCFAIGADPLMAAITRGEKFTIIMLNNAVYASTGGQAAPTTLVGQVTKTTPLGRQPSREGYPIHGAEFMAQFKSVAYSARGAVDTPAHYRLFKRYLKTAFSKQMDNIGLTYVEVLSACPAQWRLSPLDSLKHIEQKMIQEYPLGEFKNVDSIE